MICSARNIILNNPGIVKVIILDRIPRFDTNTAADPAGLKSKLSDYGNSVYREELEKCDLKDRIFIGSHSLPNDCQQNLYGHPARSGYDGIHLYGPDGRNHFTRSLCNTLQKFLIQAQP